MKTVSASDANRQFSALLQEVSHGGEITITSHGKPVARISPAKVAGHGREVARKRLIARLRRQGDTGGRTWSREELYD
ncbi:MAG: type II toxin-antitoxin system prevent-host-death family antitoxin [Halofilum sp. (in: g-proteobacteria)]